MFSVNNIKKDKNCIKKRLKRKEIAMLCSVPLMKMHTHERYKRISGLIIAPATLQKCSLQLSKQKKTFCDTSGSFYCSDLDACILMFQFEEKTKLQWNSLESTIGAMLSGGTGNAIYHFQELKGNEKRIQERFIFFSPDNLLYLLKSYKNFFLKVFPSNVGIQGIFCTKYIFRIYNSYYMTREQSFACVARKLALSGTALLTTGALGYLAKEEEEEQQQQQQDRGNPVKSCVIGMSDFKTFYCAKVPHYLGMCIQLPERQFNCNYKTPEIKLDFCRLTIKNAFESNFMPIGRKSSGKEFSTDFEETLELAREADNEVLLSVSKYSYLAGMPSYLECSQYSYKRREREIAKDFFNKLNIHEQKLQIECFYYGNEYSMSFEEAIEHSKKLKDEVDPIYQDTGICFENNMMQCPLIPHVNFTHSIGINCCSLLT